MDQLRVLANSDAFVRTIGIASPLHPDFGKAATNGIPVNLVNSPKHRVRVDFTYAYDSDPGPYPLPATPLVEGGSDHHILLVDTGKCTDYEIFGARQNGDGAWSAGSGAIFPLTSNRLRPNGLTSADAGGLPILPGLVRYEEVASGAILHALRFTAARTADSHVWPARHDASSFSGPQYPPMGIRFRLKAGFDVTPYPARVKVVLNALKKYGMILADNGAPWFVSGVPDSRWDDDELHTMTHITGAEFEAVDESALRITANSAEARQRSRSLTAMASGKQTNSITVRRRSPAAAWQGGVSKAWQSSMLN